MGGRVEQAWRPVPTLRLKSGYLRVEWIFASEDAKSKSEPRMSIRSSATLSAIPFLLLLGSSLQAEQKYVTRFDAYGGYSFLRSSNIGLMEQGFQAQAGVRVVPWMSLGFDYCRVTGDAELVPGIMTTSVQQKLTAQLGALAAAGMLPAGYSLKVPFDSVTQTFAAGPQFAYRRWEKITLFIRPSGGIIKELATPKPQDKIATAVVAQLAPDGTKKNNVMFYGFGGGVDINFSKHLSLRIQADLVRDHLFEDMLRDSRNTIRFSIGPAFNFGKNIRK